MVYDKAGGHVIIGRCSQEFIVCALSMFQTFYNCVYRKILKPSVKNGKEDITGAENLMFL